MQGALAPMHACHASVCACARVHVCASACMRVCAFARVGVCAARCLASTNARLSSLYFELHHTRTLGALMQIEASSDVDELLSEPSSTEAVLLPK